jgi:hypothetical protein
MVPDLQHALTGYAIVFFVSYFGPVLGGIAAAASCGRSALQRHFGFLTRIAVGWRWYVGSVALIAAAFITVAAISFAAGKTQLFGFWNYSVLLLFLPPPLSDGGPLEELGFRGWLLPLMQCRFRPYEAAFIVGVFWFLYHYTILLPGLQFAAPRAPEWHSVVPFFVQIIALSFIFTVMFNATAGSVPIVFVAHWLINSAIKLTLFGHWAVWPGVIAVTAIAVIVLGRRYLTEEYKVSVW